MPSSPISYTSERYAAAGLTDVTLCTYPGARHEILNETNRDEVLAELVSWLDRVVASPRDAADWDADRDRDWHSAAEGTAGPARLA